MSAHAYNSAARVDRVPIIKSQFASTQVTFVHCPRYNRSMSDSTFDSLTPAQQDAVTHVDGPLLILAGPGSGKTRVVTHRIAHLIREGVDPSSILGLTFTNKAADEMSRRVAQLSAGSSVWLGTFHRFCARLLRRYADHVGLSPNFAIYDTGDSLAALKLAIKGIDLSLSMTTPERIARQISWTKNNLITADEYQPPPGHPLGPILEEAYPAYQSQLLKANAVDFDDLLVHVARMLQDSAELREYLDERYRYILVDEYQDTNLAQYAIVRSLSVIHPNLAVTGDPDQSIYGWRGASLNNILNFEKDYPTVKVVRLEQNYRSTPGILRVADALIRNNRRRKQKELFTANDEGRMPRLVVYPTQKEEADEIIGRVAAEVQRGDRAPRDYAILYRTNALSRAFEHALRDQGIAFQIVNGLEFYQRKEIKDAIAYLRLINNPRDDMALTRIINVPARRIGKATVDKLSTYAQRQGISIFEAARNVNSIDSISKATRPRVRTFVELIDRLSQHADSSVEELLGLILTETGYLELLQQSGDPDDEERAANLSELLTAAREFEEKYGDDATLEAFLEQTALINDTDGWKEQTDRVTLMTLHAAKGLEFPVVYIVGVEQKLLPHERSMDTPEQLEEERRLLFVGITRAEQELQLSMATVRTQRGGITRTVPSVFLLELPRDEMDVTEYASNLTSLDYTEERPVRRPVDSQRLEGLEAANVVKTAAEMVAENDSGQEETDASEATAPVDPDVYQVGMTVFHPEYGPGKIAALSGQGDKRTGTVNFAVAGQRKFVLIHAKLRCTP